jgi:hypothetical protein
MRINYGACAHLLLQSTLFLMNPFRNRYTVRLADLLVLVFAAAAATTFVSVHFYGLLIK